MRAPSLRHRPVYRWFQQRSAGHHERNARPQAGAGEATCADRIGAAADGAAHLHRIGAGSRIGGVQSGAGDGSAVVAGADMRAGGAVGVSVRYGARPGQQSNDDDQCDKVRNGFYPDHQNVAGSSTSLPLGCSDSIACLEGVWKQCHLLFTFNTRSSVEKTQDSMIP
mgnify:CR=1 FL=1